MRVRFDDRAQASPGVLHKNLGGEAVLLDLGTETYFGLDAVGARMWALVTTAPSIQAAYETMLGEYDVASDVLKHDMDQFVADLVERGLLRIGNG